MALTLTRRRTAPAVPQRRPRYSTAKTRDTSLDGLTIGERHWLAVHGEHVPGLTGSGLDVTAKNAMDIRRLVQPWQARSMSYYDLVPEVKFAARFMGALLSRVRLFPAMMDEKTQEPEEITDKNNPVYKAFARIKDRNGGRAQLQKSYGTQKWLIGETYLTISPDRDRGEVWECLSPNELRVQPGGIATRFRAPMLSADQYLIGEITDEAAPEEYVVGNDRATVREYGEVLGPEFRDNGPDVIVVYRLWRQHPAYCADTETEILTETGWKSHSDLRAGERVMTLNHETGQSEWQPTQAVNRFYVEDESMVSIEGRGHSSLTTAEHRWPTLKYSRPDLRTYRDWTTSGVLNSNDRLITAALNADIPTERTFDDSFVEAVAWFYTEGSVAKRHKSAQVTLYQSESANPQYVERIRAVLTERHGSATTERMSTGKAALAEPKWREYHGSNNSTVQFWLNTAASAELLEVAPNKVVSLDFVRALTREQLELFIETSIAADGHGNQLLQKEHRRLDAFEFACILTGRSVKNGFPKSGARRINMNTRQVAHIHSRGHRMGPTGANLCPTRQTYTGIVWCPTTRNGTWLARRRGTVYYTGNSWLADSNMMACLDLLEELVLSTYSVRAQLKSRLNQGGLLAMPEEMSFPSLGNNPDEDPNSDLFQERFTQLVMQAIGDPGSSAAFAPFIVQMAGEFIKDIKLIRFNDSQGDLAEISQRTEMVERYGVGAELPPELFKSQTDLNHWTGWLVDEQTWRSYGHPAALEMADDLCACYLQPEIRESADSVDWEKVCIGIDPAEVITHPNRAKDASDAFDRLQISGKVYREVIGFNDNDAMSPEEKDERAGIEIHDGSLYKYGIPAVRANIEPSAGEVESAPGPGGDVANPATGGPNAPGPPADKVSPPPSSKAPNPGTDATNAGPAVTGSADDRAAQLLAACQAAVHRGRELAGSRLAAATTGRNAKHCEECTRMLEGVAKWDIAHTLGEERVVEQLGPITHELVDGTGAWLATLLVGMGVSPARSAEAGALVERHTGGTLYQPVAADLPSGFVRFLSRIHLPAEQA